MNEYTIIYTNDMSLFDEDIKIVGKSPKKALEQYIKKPVKKFKTSHADYIIWTWKSRIWFVW